MDQKFEDQIFGQLVKPTQTQCSQIGSKNIKKTINFCDDIQSPEVQISPQSKNCFSFKKKIQLYGVGQKNNIEEKENDLCQKQFSNMSTQIGFLSSAKPKKKLIKLQKVNKQQIFKCPICAMDKGISVCKFCQGKRQINSDNNLLKFMEYIIDFKLGQKGCYKTGLQKIQNKEPLKKLNQCFHETPKILLRKSLPNIIQKNLNNQFENKSVQKKVHKDFGCDNCGMFPIIGARYHCNQPECKNDYDLCQKCYIQIEHEHDMEQIIQTLQQKRIRQFTSQIIKEVNKNKVNFFSSSIY